MFLYWAFKLNLISWRRKPGITDGPAPLPLSMTPDSVRVAPAPAPALGFYTSFLPTSFCRYTDTSNITSHSEYVSFLLTYLQHENKFKIYNWCAPWLHDLHFWMTRIMIMTIDNDKKDDHDDWWYLWQWWWKYKTVKGLFSKHFTLISNNKLMAGFMTSDHLLSDICTLQMLSHLKSILRTNCVEPFKSSLIHREIMQENAHKSIWNGNEVVT